MAIWKNQKTSEMMSWVRTPDLFFFFPVKKLLKIRSTANSVTSDSIIAWGRMIKYGSRKRSLKLELFKRDMNPETGHYERIFRFRFSRSETPFHAACTFGKNPELAAQILDRGAVSINIQGWKPPGRCWSGPGWGGRDPSSASYTASNLMR